MLAYNIFSAHLRVDVSRFWLVKGVTCSHCFLSKNTDSARQLLCGVVLVWCDGHVLYEHSV